MLINIAHKTKYRFDRPVPYALQRLRLMPKNSAGQEVLDWEMTVNGGRCEIEYDDQHNNHVALIRVENGAEEIEIDCKGQVRTDSAYIGVIGRHRGHVPLWFFLKPTERTQLGPAIRSILSRFKKEAEEEENAVASLHRLSALILSEVDYVTGVTDANTTAEIAASEGQGVCQDHAHIFIAAARSLGFPARYVGGYLYMDDRTEQEAGHAWAEACVEGIGWVGFDISNGISPDERYVRVATGRDYSDAAPVEAMTFGGARDTDMTVKLDISKQEMEQQQQQGSQTQQQG